MVISPAVVLAVRSLDRRHLRRAGLAVGAAGVVGLLALLGWAVLTWQSRYGPMTGRAIGLRYAYLLATGTDLPVVQCALAGAVGWAASWGTGRGRR